MITDTALASFLQDLRQNILARAEAGKDFLEAEFTSYLTSELFDAGVIDQFDLCYYRQPSGSMRVDGYTLSDTSLDLFVTDFADRATVQSLTQTEVTAILRRVESFFIASATRQLYHTLEETSDAYALARHIAERAGDVSHINFYLLSDRTLSSRVTTLDQKSHADWTFSYHIWDLSRFHRLQMSKGAREDIEIDLSDMGGAGLLCLPASLSSESYQSYLVVIPATILADLYGKYGSRLLEQNVRSFLQTRAAVNRGIRSTILNEPDMFFAYNNGITATARDVTVKRSSDGLMITSLTDLQIVNGGQTTASLFHTRKRDRASLEQVFVQMKLSVIDGASIERIVPKISEYANTQNRVSAADFFSNHPFHIRMQEVSRRLWAPAKSGMQRETKWFYERARGQHRDEQSMLTATEQRQFLATYPKEQMFTKTDLAKFENVWDGEPVAVNQGAQKNFVRYANRISQQWERESDTFNDHYFMQAVARAIIFRKTEKLVSKQPWYNGGYRANIVAYTIALLAEICQTRREAFNFKAVWDRQDISQATVDALEIIAKSVHAHIMHPAQGVSNISEWCKKDACWQRLRVTAPQVAKQLAPEFFNELLTEHMAASAHKSAVHDQKMQNGIDAQQAVVQIAPDIWGKILTEGTKKGMFSPKEANILKIATSIPARIPTDKQSQILLALLDRARQERLVPLP